MMIRCLSYTGIKVRVHSRALAVQYILGLGNNFLYCVATLPSWSNTMRSASHVPCLAYQHHLQGNGNAVILVMAELVEEDPFDLGMDE